MSINTYSCPLDISSKDLKNKILEFSSTDSIWMREEEQYVVEEICSLLLNSFHYGINANALICSDNGDISNLSGERIIHIIESFYPDSAVAISEHLFLKWDSLDKRVRDCRYILIQDFVGLNLEKFCSILESFEKSDWNHSVIVCVGADTEQKLKQYDDGDYRLFYYLLGTKLYLGNNSEEDIFKAVCQRLQSLADGFVLTDEFCKKLQIYIRAVYPEAYFQNREFVDDCINRIRREHYRKLLPDRTLTADDVPHSDKAQLLMNSQVGNASKSESSVSKTSADTELPLNQTEIDYSEDEINNNQSDFEISFADKDTLNVLITNVSTVSMRDGKTTSRDYLDGSGNSFCGQMTNEAPIKSIIKRLEDTQNHLDAIIFIVSDTVQKQTTINGNPCSHIAFLIHQLKEYAKETGYELPLFRYVSIPDEPQEADVSKTVFAVYDYLRNWANEENSLRLYIENVTCAFS